MLSIDASIYNILKIIDDDDDDHLVTRRARHSHHLVLVKCKINAVSLRDAEVGSSNS